MANPIITNRFHLLRKKLQHSLNECWSSISGILQNNFLVNLPNGCSYCIYWSKQSTRNEVCIFAMSIKTNATNMRPCNLGWGWKNRVFVGSVGIGNVSIYYELSTKDISITLLSISDQMLKHQYRGLVTQSNKCQYKTTFGYYRQNTLSQRQFPTILAAQPALVLRRVSPSVTGEF